MAKISPEGDVVWHKELYGQNTHCVVYNMANLGDTAIMVVHHFLPTSRWVDIFGTRYENGGMDSLIAWDDGITLYDNRHLGFTTFDLDGNIIEQHFLTQFFLDSEGKPITDAIHVGDSTLLLTQQYLPNGFAVDRDGNVIIAKQTSNLICDRWVRCDTCEDLFQSERMDTRNGEITGQRFYIDGHWIGDNIFDGPVDANNLQLLKLNREMDSIIFCRLVLYDTVTEGQPVDYFTVWSYTTHLLTDASGNIYLSGAAEMQAAYAFLNDTSNRMSILLDSLQPDVSINVRSAVGIYFAYMVKYAPDGTMLWLHQPMQSYLDFQGRASGGTLYGAPVIDESDSTIYILGNVVASYYGDSVAHLSTNYGLGDTAWHPHKGVVFVRLRCGDGSYVGSACVPTPDGTSTDLQFSTLALQHNRLVMQIAYGRRLMGIDTVYQHHTTGANSSLALVQFDTDGHLIGIVDIGNSGHNYPNQCALHDSILYINGRNVGGANFGDNAFFASSYKAYIVRYTDTAFMSPYVYVPDTTGGDTGDVRITLAEGGADFVAYPNPFRQRISIHVENGTLQEHNGIVTATLTDLAGRREEVRLVQMSNSELGISNADSQNSTVAVHNCYTLDLTARPAATYLLTLTTADGHPHTLRLLKQNDVFGQ